MPVKKVGSGQSFPKALMKTFRRWLWKSAVIVSLWLALGMLALWWFSYRRNIQITDVTAMTPRWVSVAPIGNSGPGQSIIQSQLNVLAGRVALWSYAAICAPPHSLSVNPFGSQGFEFHWVLSFIGA
jgi:hypothetical protein